MLMTAGLTTRAVGRFHALSNPHRSHSLLQRPVLTRSVTAAVNSITQCHHHHQPLRLISFRHPSSFRSRLRSTRAKFGPGSVDEWVNDQHQQQQQQHGEEHENQSPYSETSVKLTVGVILGLNVVVFLAWQSSREQPQLFRTMMQNFTVSESNLREGRYHTLVTSAFSQMALPHLLFNLLALGSFGLELGRTIGPRRFIAIYFGSAIAASIAHVLYTRHVVPRLRSAQHPQTLYARLHQQPKGDHPALGSSGAAMAVALVYAMLFPSHSFLVMFVLPVPAWMCVMGVVAFDVVGSLRADPQDSVGHAAHLGGAAFGLLYYLAVLRKGRLVSVRQTINSLQPRTRSKQWSNFGNFGGRPPPPS